MGLTGYRQALASSPFRRLWLAAVISRTGDAVNFVALPLFVYHSTGSPAAVAVLVLLEGGGMIVGGLAAQFVVDRTPPRPLLVSVDLVRAAAASVLALAPSFPVAVAVAAVLAVGTSWFSPASGALVPRLVDAELVPTANALQWTAGVVLQLVAAPLGGLLVSVASARMAFAVNTLSFVLSAAVLSRLPSQRALAAATGPWRQLPEALRAVSEVPVLVPLLVMQALAALAVGATSALLVVLAASGYGLGGAGYGAWLAAVGAGALIGPLVLPALTRLPAQRAVPSAYVVRGAGDIGLGVLCNGVAGGALLFVYGLSTSTGAVSFQTLVQRAAPARLRGRAFALLDVTWQSGRLVSIAIGGALASIVGIRPLFVGGGCLLVLAGAVGLVTFRGGGR